VRFDRKVSVRSSPLKNRSVKRPDLLLVSDTFVIFLAVRDTHLLKIDSLPHLEL
jgi:hypothetical protein